MNMDGIHHTHGGQLYPIKSSPQPIFECTYYKNREDLLQCNTIGQVQNKGGKSVWALVGLFCYPCSFGIPWPLTCFFQSYWFYPRWLGYPARFQGVCIAMSFYLTDEMPTNSSCFSQYSLPLSLFPFLIPPVTICIQSSPLREPI